MTFEEMCMKLSLNQVLHTLEEQKPFQIDRIQRSLGFVVVYALEGKRQDKALKVTKKDFDKVVAEGPAARKSTFTTSYVKAMIDFAEKN